MKEDLVNELIKLDVDNAQKLTEKLKHYALENGCKENLTVMTIIL